MLTTCNYFAERDGHFPDIDSGKLTVPGYLQARLAESRVIRVFNHIDAANIVSDGALRRARQTAGRSGMPATIRRARGSSPTCTTRSGSTRIDAGGLDEAWRARRRPTDVRGPTDAEQLKANLAAATRRTS